MGSNEFCKVNPRYKYLVNKLDPIFFILSIFQKIHHKQQAINAFSHLSRYKKMRETKKHFTFKLNFKDGLKNKKGNITTKYNKTCIILHNKHFIIFTLFFITAVTVFNFISIFMIHYLINLSIHFNCKIGAQLELENVV